MRSFDLSPLFRSSIGFDRMSRLLDSAMRMDDSALSYPPYNIEVTGENAYRITMAIAGFSEKDLTITAQDNSLIIAGKIERQPEVQCVVDAQYDPGADQFLEALRRHLDRICGRPQERSGKRSLRTGGQLPNHIAGFGAKEAHLSSWDSGTGTVEHRPTDAP